MIPLYPRLKEAFEALGLGTPASPAGNPVGGGCINRAARIDFPGGNCLFYKENTSNMVSMFQAEAEGLLELKRDGGPAVPKPLAVIQDSSRSGLLMEYIPDGSPSSGFWEDFGRRLANMHRSGGSGQYGWNRDNTIGSTPQENTPDNSWIDFFREKRLLFQGQMARSRSLINSDDMGRLENLCSRLGEQFYEPEKPEPLHGDLWSGNYLSGADGKAWIIDPAFYYGCGEADLAMTEMFGGYAAPFYHAYKEVNPLPPGYGERRDIYNLYHYLNHLNLFGSSYLSSVRNIIQRYC